MVVAGAVVFGACGTDAIGVDACRQIEQARCEQAPACGISLEPPYHASGTDVAECIRAYDIACLHGLASGSDPGPIAVRACVVAIQSAPTTGSCSVVAVPASASACAWLVPNSAVGDASSESVADAGTDAALGE